MTAFPEEGPAGLWNNLTSAIARLWRRDGGVEERPAPGREELLRIARDANISMADLLTLTEGSCDTADLIRNRLVEAGVDLRAISPALLRSLQRCCAQCEEKAVCARDLESQSQPAAWPPYCPNKDTLALLMTVKCH